jgi:hypothetical protein
MRKTLAAIAAAALALVPVLLGAQDKPQEPKPKESRTAYLRRVFEKDRAGYGDACRAVLSLVKDEHSDGGFEDLRKDLEARGIVDGAWDLAESSPLERGTLAYMLCKAFGIKGGVTMGVFGVSRRYALRECVHLGLMPGGTVGQYLSGRELIDVLGNVEVWRESGSTDSLRK